ncbi:MAG: hypothetical protein KGL46_11560 [Hyphomicrobiales bacterium]|nr:hypothetical protein [Hyphomicrobiales bacterium]
MRIPRLIASFLAGGAATATHLALMGAKQALGVLPQFQPYEDIQRSLLTATGGSLPPGLAFLLSMVNGSLVLGFVFGRIYPILPGQSWVGKGLFFGLCAWLASGLIVFPAIGRGVFAWGVGLGAAPALLMAAMLAIYSLAMSFAWRALTD